MDRNLYRALYEELDCEVGRIVRSKIKFMGGDLLEMAKSENHNQTAGQVRNQANERPSGLTNPFYWGYRETKKLERRLRTP
jgi:hypothetical protein